MPVNTAFIEVVQDLWRFVIAGFRYQNTGNDFAPLQFEPGNIYGPKDESTIKARLLLTGMYDERELSKPLQSSEYVTLWMREHGYHVDQAAHRWLPGQWHMKLKGLPGVHIGIKPKPASIFEFFDTESMGHLGVVVEIDNDDTITVTSIGMESTGIFETHHIPKERWQSFGAVFTTLPKESIV
jgi:hypothetical protein